MKQTLEIATLYKILKDISILVHSSTSAREISEVLVRKVTEILDAKGTMLRILNLETDELECCAAFGLSEKYLAKGPVTNRELLTNFCRDDNVVIIDDVLGDPRIEYPREAWEEGIRMFVNIPLMVHEDVVGVLRVAYSGKRSFSEEEIDFLRAVAQQCACAINKARLYEKQQARYAQLALQTEKLTALGRMAAGIAHEINNPLAGILLYSTNLIKKVPIEGFLREGLDIIIQETVRCRTIIRDLLEFARDREPQKVKAHTNQIIERVLSILDNQFRLQRITVEKRLSSQIPENMVDVNKMEQVFVNLLLNAVEAIGSNGTIIVTTRLDREGGFEVTEIQDTGCGIPTENLHKIFEPFFSTKPKGTGLGLSVSFGIVQSHGGDIQVESSPGWGTCFSIRIPLLQGPCILPRENQSHGTR